MENIYYLKGKLETISKKIESIEGFKYDTNKLKYDLNKLNDSLEGALGSTNSAVMTQNDKTIASITSLINSFDEYVTDIQNKFIIYTHARIIKDELNNDITPQKLNSITTLLISDLKNYRTLYESGYRSDMESELYQIIYDVIKTEFRVRGTSTLLDQLISNNIGIKELKELINQDIKKYINEEDIYRRNNEVLSIDTIDKKMVYLLSFNENGYKDKILDEIRMIQKKKEKKQEEIKDMEKTKYLKSKISQTSKNNYKEACSLIRKSIIPKILSIAILIGANHIASNYKENHKTYKSTVECYDTVDGHYEEKIYQRSDVGDVKVKIYYPVGEDVGTTRYPEETRNYEFYDVENTGINIEEYLNQRLSNSDMYLNGSTQNTELNEKEPDMIKLVQIVKSIDYNDVSSDGIPGFIRFILIVGWFIIDLVLDAYYYDCYRLTGGLIGGLVMFKNFLDEINEYIKKRKNYLEELNKKENGKTYSKEELRKLNIELIKLEETYKETLIKYKKLTTLLEYNDYARKLK